MTTPDYRASDRPDWQPYRDPRTGEVVTVTPEQCAAVIHALNVYLRVEPNNPENVYVREAVQALTQNYFWRIHHKSCLLGRLLCEGKPPLVDAPPVRHAAPDYSVEVPRD